MIFTSTDLARRIDLADAEVLIEGARAATRHSPDAFARPIGGGIAAYTGSNAPFNKIAGLGYEPLDEAELESVERDYADRGCPVQIELATLADPELPRLLVSRGYMPVGYEDVLGIDPSCDIDAQGHIEIEPVTDLDPWLDVLLTAFAAQDTQGIQSHEHFPREAMEKSVRDFIQCRGVMRFLASLGGIPAGAASMRMAPPFALLTGAATLLDHRRRGVQTALLAHRLHLASEAGAELALITTLPGSKSQENAHKRGFELLFTRAHFVRESPG